MKMRIAAGALMSMVLAAGAAQAQTWDHFGATKAITGQSYDTTETAALVVSGSSLFYCDYQGPNSPEAANVGEFAEVYRFPLTWYEGESHEYFTADPAKSPTGHVVTISGSVEAVAYYVDGPNYQGYVVGLLTTYDFSSGTDSGQMVVISPGALPQTADEAKALTAQLAEAGIDGQDPNGTGGQPSCVEQCLNTYNTEKANALDRYKTNVKNYCGILGIPGGFLAGCGIGTAICGWAVPPFSTVFCCVAGGIIGAGVGSGTCMYVYTDIYESELRQARRNYENCLRNCGVIIAEM